MPLGELLVLERGMRRRCEDHKPDILCESSPCRARSLGMIHRHDLHAGERKATQALGVPDRRYPAHPLPIRMIATISP